jgi:membrane-associated protein
MSSLSDLLLTGVVSYGAPLFGLILLLGQLGIPLPTTLLVVAAGAFSRQGILDWGTAAMLGLLGSVLGDSMSFSLGRFARGWVYRRFGTSTLWLQAQTSFNHRGGLAVYLTRFLLTAIALPTNLIAGGSGYRYPRFLVYGIAGEATWIFIYGGLGYIFGSQWELISQFLSDFGGLALGLAILGAGSYFILRQTQKKRKNMIRILQSLPLEDTQTVEG